MTTAGIISYIRVSTGRQGRSGLGLEAQREAIARFAEAEGFKLAGEFVEVETGKGADAPARRPQLAAPLAEAKHRKCAVAVAKLDRLSRDVHFISGLMAERVQFVVTELPTSIRSCCTSTLRRPRLSVGRSLYVPGMHTPAATLQGSSAIVLFGRQTDRARCSSPQEPGRMRAFL